MMRSGRNTRSAVTGANSGTITRTGTRLTTPVSKPKPCIVRIEKIPQKKSEADKPIGSVKNRNFQAVKRTPDRLNRSVQQSRVVEKLRNKSPTTPSTTTTSSNMMAGRSRRTPKPNPKYQNDSLITSFKGKISKSDEEDDDDDENVEEHFEDSGESDEEYKLDGEDKLSSDEEAQSLGKTLRGQIKGKVQPGNHPSLIQFSTSSSSTANRARPNLRNAIATGSIRSDSTTKTTNTPDIKKSIPVVARSRQDIASNLLRKRKMEFEKEREAERKRLNMGLYDSSDTEKSPARTQKDTKIYNSKQISGTSTPPTQQGQANKLQTSSGKIIQQITTKSQSMSANKSVSELTLVNRQKQMNINGKNLIQKTTPSPNSSIKIMNKKPIEIDDAIDPIGASGTPDDDDFEQMPTFTIVNINDIIGKKGDVLIEKSANDFPPKKSNEVISLSPPSRFNNNNNNTNNNNNNNRRKTMHTTILTDKTDNKLNKTIAVAKRGQQPVSGTKSLINNSNLTKTISRSSTTSNQSSTITQTSKGPPRILNTGINKKLSPIISSATSKTMYSKNNENEKLLKNNEKLKENLQTSSSTTTPGSTTTSPSASNLLAGIKRKLPSEKVVIQRQGNKIIKKITCFETWYVINIPEQINLLQRNKLDITLIKIANSIKTIQLPSNEWTCKVSLQKMNAVQLSNAKAKNLEQFTGDVGDPAIKDNEKYKYQPVNVMFRRNSIVKNNRMPYDRAVIFKNGMFFTNIEGKNVQLIGSPNLIKSLQDIEILLQLVDDMTLVSQFIEPAGILPN